MIRISGISLSPDQKTEALQKKCAEKLHISPDQIVKIHVVKQSVDARKKPDVRYIYTVDVQTKREEKILQKNSSLSVFKTPDETYHFPDSGDERLKVPPIIAGSGPAGLFCALFLAENGYRPILLERGEPVEKRTASVRDFFADGVLNPESNVQFGEGGAGTFSDGKLNTMTKDPAHRNRKVLETFYSCGAPPEILYSAKPHIGTDILPLVVKSLREKILDAGGEIFTSACLTDLHSQDEKLTEIEVNHRKWIPAEVLVLATGHSARDTISMLYERGLAMTAKAFAVGLRIEHPQKMIDEVQYGKNHSRNLPPADYKLTAKTSFRRGVYSFCMCPGGTVINASSEEKALAVNGMSTHARDNVNANSAIVVTVTPDDYAAGKEVPQALSGLAWQRKLEQAAYQAGEGHIPVQLYADFKRGKRSSSLGEIYPSAAGGFTLSDLRTVLPDFLCQPLFQAMEEFGRKIPGFDRPDAVFSGIESRTSSPVRILRNEAMESNIAGIYPCGEGAGYAGGIMSAATDGIRAAEQIAMRYARPEDGI